MMRFIFSVLVLLSLSACTTEIMHFSAISTRPIDHMNTLATAEIVKNTHGSDIQHLVTIIPIGFEPNIQDAVNHALKKADADMLINVSMYRESFWIPLIYGQNRYNVVGDAVRFKKD